jgi:hypothetical protein
VPEFSAMHGPSAAINARFGFVTFDIGSPPVAVTYTSVVPVHEYNPAILKFPFVSVVTTFVSRGVATVLSPVVPTAYNCMVEFAIGCLPPITTSPSPVLAAAPLEIAKGAEHPEKRTTAIKTVACIILFVFIPLYPAPADKSFFVRLSMTKFEKAISNALGHFAADQYLESP